MLQRPVVLCAAICVLLLFLFPLVHGPFPATHGPATAFRGRRAFVALLSLVFNAAKSSLSHVRFLLNLHGEASLSAARRAIGLMHDPDLAVLRC
jgi:hypothetical protein